MTLCWSSALGKHKKRRTVYDMPAENDISRRSDRPPGRPRTRPKKLEEMKDYCSLCAKETLWEESTPHGNGSLICGDCTSKLKKSSVRFQAMDQEQLRRLLGDDGSGT